MIVQNREGKHTEEHRNRMFISQITYEGFAITVHSTLELVPYLLEVGFEYVLTERFCQDPLEEHFGDQRKLGGRAQNPDVYAIGNQTQNLRVQKQVTCQTGNTRGRYDHRRTHEDYSNEKCPPRKKAKKVSII